MALTKVSGGILDPGINVAGVVTGLAWTSVGGDILFIESILSKGKGNLNITGKTYAANYKTDTSNRKTNSSRCN